ncbi:MAG TPA: hypothetical protein PLE33_08285 [Candidatus Cloacimonas sp.]|jgi:hypothetical protein|nr:hypothetical protein [Candidatus Cloacimonas sp.]HPS61239.1 hypothetical protein [Candidatus Cloacimonas sp.]
MKLSAIFYAIVILAFFMPFFLISCDKSEVASLSGVKLVTGGEVKLDLANIFNGSSGEGKYENPAIGIQLFAIVAFILAIAALIMALVLPLKMYPLPAYISILGVISLQLLNIEIPQMISSFSNFLDANLKWGSTISLKVQPGFWIANIGFILGGISTLLTGIKKSSESSYIEQPEEYPASEIQGWEEEYPAEETISEQEEENIPPEEEIPTLIKEENIPPEEENPTLLEEENPAIIEEEPKIN